jgi:hypothetical protein
MNLTQLHPAFAMNLGYDVNAMNDSEKVTLVRRRVVYEELVMSKDEFDKMNQIIGGVDIETEDDEEFYLSDLKMEDIGFFDFTDEQTEYIAFPGDVTSFTDDAIAFLFENQPWTCAYESVKIAS